MKTVRVAFDVDGTLRCSCTETCQDVNQRMVDLLAIMKRMKNTNVCIWSGGGKQYADQWGRRLGVKESHCFAKYDAPHMDLAIDDQQDFALADMNLIVREK